LKSPGLCIVESISTRNYYENCVCVCVSCL